MKDQPNIMTIPELRRAFEHIETFMDENQHTKKEDLVRALQKEWKGVFKKSLDHDSAEAYVEYKRAHKKQTGGAAAPLAGAPLDYTVRPGLYITPGVNQGSYAQVPAYVDKGFWNPEPGQSYDPVAGQTVYPTRTPLGMGSNLVGGSKKSRKTKGKQRRLRTRKQQKQRGGTFMSSAMDAIQQMSFRPFSYGTPPPSAANDAQSGMRGQPLGQSPDPTQTVLPYRMMNGATPPGGSISVSTAPINLKQDIRVN